MTLQQLEYIVAIDEHRHFVKAAEACGITQSTLSSMVHKLEEELDLTIFDRNSHPIRPTLAGEQILKQARVVIFHSKQLEEMSKNERKSISGNIRLGITPTVAPYIIPKLFRYINTIPDITITADEFYHNNLVQKLKNAELDIVIMSYPGNNGTFLEIPLYREKLWAYVSSNDPLFNEESIDFNTMPRERLWALKNEICFQRQLSGLCYMESKRSSMYESGNITTLIRIADENEGFTIIPELHIPILKENRKANIRPFKEPCPERVVSLFVRHDFVREGLLNVIADGIKTIIPQEMLDSRLLKYPIRL